MPVYNVPLTTADGETFFHRVTAKNRGEAMRKAEALGEFGAKAGIPSIHTASLPGGGGSFDPLGGGGYAQQRTSGPTAGAIKTGGPLGLETGMGFAFDPKAQAAAAAATSNLPSAVTDWGMFGEQFDPSGGNIDLSGDLGVVDTQAEYQEYTYGPEIRPWQERVADIRVEYDPNYTGGGSKGRRLIVPQDMWRFDSKNRIGNDEIQQVMRHLAASEGSDTYKALVGQFLDQATSFFKDEQTWGGVGGKGRQEFVSLSLKEGTYDDSEEFTNTRDSLLANVIGKREAAAVNVSGDTGDRQPWDHLPERYHNQKMYDKYAALSPEEKKVVENPAISEFFQDRPKEFLSLSPYLQDIVRRGEAVDHKTLEGFHKEEDKEEALEFHAVGQKDDPNLSGMQTFEPLDDLDDFTTFAQETDEPGAVWKLPPTFVEDKALDVGPDITLPPDQPTFKPAPPAVVPPPGGAPPPPGGPEGGPGGPGGPGGFDPNLSFEANMMGLGSPQGIVDNRGLFEISPTAGYRRAFGNVFGEGFGRRGPIGGYLQGLQDPLTAAFQGGAIRNLLNPQPGLGLGAGDAEGMALPGQSFQNFLSQAQQAEGGLGSVWNQALQDVNTFRGMQQADIPVAAQQYFAPQSVQDVGQAARLMGAAQRARYSPLVSGMFRPQSYEDLYGDYVLQEQDRAQLGQQAMPQNFYDFAASRFGL